MNEPRVEVTDLRAVRLCMSGGRAWFAARGLSWSEFVTHGLPLSQVEAMADGLANRVAAHARKRLGL